MKKTQLLLGVFALAAAGGASMLAINLANKPPEVIQAAAPAAPEIKLERVLVAAQDISLGTSLNTSMVRWQDWPEEGLASGYITESSNPDGLDVVNDAIARATFFEGEPIRDSKLVKSDRGYMSAILPAGQRAVATTISTETSAGGFILPNDRVDVIMTRRAESENGRTAGFITETILENVRILAIDQTVEEQDGESVVVGETATLQLSPEQAQILVVAQQMADRLALSLRSLADSNEEETTGAEYLLSGGRGKGRIRIIKYGKRKEYLIGKDQDQGQSQ